VNKLATAISSSIDCHVSSKPFFDFCPSLQAVPPKPAGLLADLQSSNLYPSSSNSTTLNCCGPTTKGGKTVSQVTLKRPQLSFWSF